MTTYIYRIGITGVSIGRDNEFTHTKGFEIKSTMLFSQEQLNDIVFKEVEDSLEIDAPDYIDVQDDLQIDYDYEIFEIGGK